MNARHSMICLLACVLTASCTRQPPPQKVAPAMIPAAPGWPAFTTAFIDSRFKANPYFAVQSGRHEFDGQMPDWSRAALLTDVDQLRWQLLRLEQFDPAALTPAQRYERDYLRWVIASALFSQAGIEEPYRNPAWYLAKLDPTIYLAREYAPLPQRMRGLLGYLRAIPRLTADIRANLRTPMPRPFVERGVTGFGGYAAFYRNEVPRYVRQLDDRALRQELDAALAAAAQCMDELVAWLESQRATATDDFALGAVRLTQLLRVTEQVDAPLEELELLGRRDLERNRAALVEACASFAPHASLAVCVDRMRADKPAAGAVGGARAQLADLRQFVIDHRIATVPGTDQALVARANPSRIESLWGDYAFSEGWAHYVEEMMYDEGLGGKTPEARIGMLANALLRDVRLLSAICLHSGCMSLAESEKMFREQAFADAGNARQQAIRGAVDPAYLGDTLGKLMIRKLRADWLAAHPVATLRQFHDQLLSHGAPPVPMARRAMIAGTGPAL